MAKKDDVTKIKEALKKSNKEIIDGQEVEFKEVKIKGNNKPKNAETPKIEGQDFSKSHDIKFETPEILASPQTNTLSQNEIKSLSGTDNKEGGLETIPFPKRNDMVINQLDKMAMETQIVPLSDSDSHPTMDAEVFQGLMRTPKVNNKILIMVRHKSSPLPNHETMADLTYYDEESRTIVNSKAIPNFYKQQYKNIYGRKDYIFYCNIEDLDAIKSMLKKDKDIMQVSKKKLEEFLSDI